MKVKDGLDGVRMGLVGVGTGLARRKPRSRPKLCFARFPNQNRISESDFCLLDPTRLSPARGWPYSSATRIPPGQKHKKKLKKKKLKLDLGTSKFESGACDLSPKGRTNTRKQKIRFSVEGESRMLPGCSQSDLRMIPEIAQK